MKIIFTLSVMIFLVQFSFAQKLGIGTNNPTHPLTVVVPVNKGITQIKGSVELGFYTSPSSAYFQTWSNHSLHFATYGSGAQMTISTSGNVGIGTAAPTQKLDVDGKIRMSGGNPAYGSILTTTDANGNTVWQPNVTGETKSLYIPFAAFVGSSAFMGYENVNNSARKSTGYLAEDYLYQAPLLLPVGTLIKEITWYYVDNNVSMNLEFGIKREFIGSKGNISSSSSSGALNVDWHKNVSVQHEMGNYFYWLEIGTFSWSADESLRFKGALITYQ